MLGPTPLHISIKHLKVLSVIFSEKLEGVRLGPQGDLAWNDPTVKAAVISPEVHIEWIIFRTLIAKKPEDSIALQRIKNSPQMKCWLQCSLTYKR